ncbi:sulfotransferase 1 family member D1-like [Phlebotomus argentipes]|uniref:sulfotransferase 1 family member D1-like n=1 Tax=Phlebotomus argentipes TaxID=94469 RepID=UPI002892B7A0|nr:sulfotransferase 1 family member D1-like [Phlebotomus argentipes]
MSITCEKVPPSETSKRVSYVEETHFIRVRNTEIPDNIPIIEKCWTDGFSFPANVEKYIEQMYNFQVRPDDVWLITFPKCGCTWSQELVWQICNDIKLDTDLRLVKKYPFLEHGCLWKTWSQNPKLNFLTALENMPSPRFIKTHLPAALLPKDIWRVRPKIVFVARNAKDVITSYYHHYRAIPKFSGTFSDFTDLFMENRINYTPYCSHILNFWTLRNEENVLFLTFEDMKNDYPSVIERTAKFFGKSLTEQQIIDLTDHQSFEKFSKNPLVNYEEEMRHLDKESKGNANDFRFVRKGKVNSFKDEMPPGMIYKINLWLEQQLGNLKNNPEIRRIFFNE